MFLLFVWQRCILPVQTNGAQAQYGAGAEENVQWNPNVAQNPTIVPAACKPYVNTHACKYVYVCAEPSLQSSFRWGKYAED